MFDQLIKSMLPVDFDMDATIKQLLAVVRKADTACDDVTMLKDSIKNLNEKVDFLINESFKHEHRTNNGTATANCGTIDGSDDTTS